MMHSLKSLTVSFLVALQTAGTLTLACSHGQPAIKDSNTVTVNLFDEFDNWFQTTSMGVLNECHNADDWFVTFNQAVGQNMFGRNIHIYTYTGVDCTGDYFVTDLTNNDVCWVLGEKCQTFQIA
ncbi:hypothetical protein BX600DRAFT_446375 [Xylariales sp. PMI_506]|nr:hypothetical protein BX600DRAFT_446375 [Xylariales sp. PMI_506]